MLPLRRRVLSCCAVAVAACSGPPGAPPPAGGWTVAPGWRAEAVHRAGAGVWYAHVDRVVDAFGQAQVIAGDDDGRFLLLTGYSGQWTAHQVVCDGLWVAPTRSADVDPRVPGRELYAAGRAGSVHQVTLRPQPFGRFTLESVEIGHAPGEEFHAVVAADLLPGGPDELLAFGNRGTVYELLAAAAGEGFSMRAVAAVPGRVRDAVVVSAADGPPELFAVSRSGDVVRMVALGGGFSAEVVHHEDCGLGRIAAPRGRSDLLYTTRDDGAVVRLERGAAGWQRRVVFAGGEGPRGLAVGRFAAHDRETFAVYGYDRRVHLVEQGTDGAFTATTVFAAGQKGHWLAVGELDGRNGTDELVAAGFDGEVVLLARVPGYALPGAALPPGGAARG